MRRIVSLLFPLGAAFALANIAAAQDLPQGVTLLRGTFVPNVQPDGNSTLLAAPEGLIAIDTGRHAAHTERLLDSARQQQRPIVAVINTHWHLDHIGGNGRVRDAYPGVTIYASGALADARKGFLANYRAQLEDAIAHASDAAQIQAWREEIALIDAAPRLAPDHVIARTETPRIAGKPLELHLAAHSVTAGDVWVYAPTERVLIAGDLVTLPVPLFDTACPAQWQKSLAELDRVKFARLIPGHGPALDHAQFRTYRQAFDKLLACSASAAEKNTCIDGWVHDAQTLLPESERAFARQLLDYYVDNSLRAPVQKTAALCAAAT